VSSPTNLAVAVPDALIAALSFGTTAALQQRATKQVPEQRALRPQLLLELFRNPM